MNNSWSKSSSEHSWSSWEQDILIKRILLTHDPDGGHGCDLDSEILLRLIESIMYYATPSQGSIQEDDLDVSGFEIDGTLDPLGNSIYNISCKILCRAYAEKNEDLSALSVLNLLGCFKWQHKMVLALLAFATLYGKLGIIMQCRNHNTLAEIIAIFQQPPENIDKCKPICMALVALVRTLAEVIRCVRDFECLPITHVELEDHMITATKTLIYHVAYWVVRITVVCNSLIRNLTDTKMSKDPCLFSAIIWEIKSLKIKISTIYANLRAQVDACQRQTDQQMHIELRDIFQRIYTDNQEVLRVLLQNDLPLKLSSKQSKVSISALKDKIVILLISKPELLPLENLLFLVHQTYDHPLHSKKEGTYDIVWFPISTSGKWSNDDIRLFTFLSNSLAWYSIRQPWSMSSTIIKYAKEEWGYDSKPIMVVLDSLGRVTNLDASDMVWIWGARAYPFSAIREKELWTEEKWSLGFLLNNMSPLFTLWVEERRTICIYGSTKLDWIRELCTQMKDIQGLDQQLQVIYVGKKDPGQLVAKIVSMIEKERLSNTLSLTKMHFFWHRLDSIRRSKLRLGENTNIDPILREVAALLQNTNEAEDGDYENWMIIGKGSSTNVVNFRPNDWIKFFSQYAIWKKYIPKVELVDVIKLFLEPPPPKPCSKSSIVSYKEGLMEKKVICEVCKHPIVKYIIYDVV